MLRHTPLVAGLAVLTLAACSAGGVTNGASVVRELGRVKDRMDQVDREIAAIQPARPIKPASARRWAAEVRKELPRYDVIREDALALEEMAQEVEDADVQRAADLLVRMIEQRHDEMTLFVRAVERRPFRPELLDLLALASDEVEKTNEEWRKIAERLSERYATA